mgnify:CR=1 FL=1
MPKINICAGQCGETVDASAECEDGRYVKFSIGKCCEHVEKLKPFLESEPIDAFTELRNFESSLIYEKSGKCLPHVTCPVPSGFLKLIELASGMAVASDVSIKIES